MRSNSERSSNQRKAEHLFTVQDVKRVRELLLKQQEGKDPIIDQVIPPKQAVLDHDHKTQYVRAVLHRQVNVLVGKIENAYLRYISWWYTGTLPQLLRNIADYLDKDQPQDYVHPAFVKKLASEFNKLKEREKQDVLIILGVSQEDLKLIKNGTQRKDKFVERIKTGNFDFDTVVSIIRSKQ